MTDMSQPSREDRLKAALRANLQRRKAQARGRVVPATESPPAPVETAKRRDQ